MMTTGKWHDRFIALAWHVAQWSKDPSTKVGAVLVGRDRRDIALGYNGFPPGIDDRPDRLADREVRLRLMQHAERNVLDNARFDVRGGVLYTTFFVCSECAKSIVSRKISCIVCPPAADREPWVSDARWSQQLLLEAKVLILRYDPEGRHHEVI